MCKEVEERSKCERCRKKTFDFANHEKGKEIKFICALGLPGFPLPENADCSSFDSKYIEYPVTINGIKNCTGFQQSPNCGRLVRIAPCGAEYGGKTYFGIHLGELSLQTAVFLNCESKVLSLYSDTNPAIFVPELKKIIWGMESFWGYIESEKELKDLTPEETTDCWYMRLLRDLFSDKKGSDNQEKKA